MKAGDSLKVDVDVTNAGAMDGEDVVEVYVVPPQQEGNPIRTLRGFKRVHVLKGKTEHVQVTLAPRELSFVDMAGDRNVAAGKYQVMIGNGGTTALFSIIGEQKLPE